MTTLLPLYVHPFEDPAAWRAVAVAESAIIAVVNVHNGPGAALEGAYRAATELLRTAGVPMLGYVDLGYGRRTDVEVEGDLAAWQRYPVEGIFFDQVPTDPSVLGAVARFVGRGGDMIVLNPGTRPHPAYAQLADLICTFEGPWSAYRELPAEPDWPNAAHLVYGVPPAELAQARALLACRVGGGLVTDLDAPLPYCGVPSWLLPVAANR